MYQTIYETAFKFNIDYIYPIIMAIICLLIFKLIETSYKEKNVKLNAKLLKRFCTILVSILVLANALIIILKVNEYDSVVDAYDKGDYEIVEGYVKDFKPMPVSGHGREYFTVDGVTFAYSDSIDMFGYHQTKPHGGIVYGNNQYLRIGYVQYNGNNEIVLIQTK